MRRSLSEYREQFLHLGPSVGGDEVLNEALAQSVGECRARVRGREAAVEATQADQVVVGDGFVEGAALIVRQLPFGVDGKALVEPCRQSAKAVEGRFFHQQVGQLVDDSRQMTLEVFRVDGYQHDVMGHESQPSGPRLGEEHRAARVRRTLVDKHLDGRDQLLAKLESVQAVADPVGDATPEVASPGVPVGTSWLKVTLSAVCACQSKRSSEKTVSWLGVRNSCPVSSTTLQRHQTTAPGGMEPRRRMSQSHVTATSRPASKSVRALQYSEEAQEKTRSVPNSTSISSMGRWPRPSKWKEMESGSCRVASLTLTSKLASIGVEVGVGVDVGVGVGVGVGVDVGAGVGVGVDVGAGVGAEVDVGVGVGVRVDVGVGVGVGVDVGVGVGVETRVGVGPTVSPGESHADKARPMTKARMADISGRITASARSICSGVEARRWV